MPKTLTSEQLRQWYKNFAKELYERAQIDITQKEDLGRVKNFYITEWDLDEPMHPQGDFQYAYIPHKQLQYDNPPPPITEPNAYFSWMMDQLEPATTDEQIEKLMEMSKAGTLMVFGPGGGDSNMQQVYTDEFGRITVSPPLSEMTDRDRENLPDHLKLPKQPAIIHPEADPAEFGLEGFPPKPVPPENMNPGWLSWLGYKLFKMDTDYAKLVRYNKAVENYPSDFKKWEDSLDTTRDEVQEYNLAKIARQEYLTELENFKSKPLGLASAIDGGYRETVALQARNGERDADGMPPIFTFKAKEVAYLKKQHGNLPQGQLLSKLEDHQEALDWAERTDTVVTHLVGNQARPDALELWLHRKVYRPGTYQMEPYELPKHPNGANTTKEERKGFQDMCNNLAEIGSFAALTSPAVSGEPPFEGFTAEESAQLRYTQILQNLFTYGRPADDYMCFLEPARQKGKQAMEEYLKGNVKPMADLLRTSIVQTNREIASLSGADSDHSLNALYLVSRMWKTAESDPKLMEAMGLTKEQVLETKGNIALRRVMIEAREAKRDLLEHALFKRNMTPEQVKQAGSAILLGEIVSKNLEECNRKNAEIVESSPGYLAALEAIGAATMGSTLKNRELEAAQRAKDPAGIERAQRELAQFMKDLNVAQANMNLEILKYPAHETNEQLISEDWCRDAKNALKENCNLDRLVAMDREAIGMLLKNGTSFTETFPSAPANAPQREAEAPVAARVNEGLAMN